MKILLFVSSWFLLISASLAQTASIDELKGAYLINFVKFARFEEKVSDMTICIVDRPQVYEYINEKLPSTINDININIKNLSNTDDINSCNIVYTSQLGEQINFYSFLTITDSGGGGIIEFIELDNRLKFTVDVRKASQAKVSFPVHVLNLAVRKDELSLYEQVPTHSICFNKSIDSHITYGFIDNRYFRRILFDLSSVG